MYNLQMIKFTKYIIELLNKVRLENDFNDDVTLKFMYNFIDELKLQENQIKIEKIINYNTNIYQ